MREERCVAVGRKAVQLDEGGLECDYRGERKNEAVSVSGDEGEPVGQAG